MTEITGMNTEEKQELMLSDYLASKSLEKCDLSKVATLMIKHELPVVRALQSKDVKDLAGILLTECVIKGISLWLFTQGAWRVSDSQPVAYHSHHAVAIWRHIAEMQNLSKIVGYTVKYVLTNCWLSNVLQSLYALIHSLHSRQCTDKMTYEAVISGWLEKQDDKDMLTHMIDRDHLQDTKKCRFISINSNDIDGWEYESNKQIYVVCGSYDLRGIDGYAMLKDSESQKNEYHFRYEIDHNTTKLGNSRAEPSPYSKNPRAFLETKFMRHCNARFYQSLGVDLSVYNQEDNEDGYTESEVKTIKAGMQNINDRFKNLPKTPNDTKLVELEDRFKHLPKTPNDVKLVDSSINLSDVSDGYEDRD